ncbi:ABC transporter substrate-binding protein [Clostridium tyrobutyricum]|uniref:ABC transporter substrate-binding protein n=1 Tax=Clostridium tyrobutyricum TaxID=1519 RepID=UPI0030D0B008
MKFLKKITSKALILILIGAFFSGCSQSSKGSSGDKKEVIKIGVGYQTVTSQTWGALIMKNKKLFEKYLEQKYPDKDFVIDWFNAQSGPPLTNNMIAGKIQFSFMGDMPIIINGEKGQTTANYKSVFLAFDGKGEEGKNQAILVSKDSKLKSVKDLKGKTIATPLGSSAHRLLLAELDKNGITDEVNVTNQDVTVGTTNLEQKKIDAVTVWEPFTSLIETKNIGKILVDGSDTKIDYLDGVVADKTWVEKNKGYTKAFLQALIESHKFIRENPDDAAKIFAEESKYPLEVTKKIVENVRFDSVIYDKDISTMEGSKDFLKKLKKIKDVDLNKFIDSQYIEEAYKESKEEYPSPEVLKENWQKLK